MKEYYTVFNVSDANPIFSIALKDPSFDPVEHSIIPDIIKENSKVVAISLCIFVGLSIITFIVIYRKRKTQKKSFVFETYQEYE